MTVQNQTGRAISFNVTTDEAPDQIMAGVLSAIEDFIAMSRPLALKISNITVKLEPASAEEGDPTLVSEAILTGFTDIVPEFPSPSAVRSFFTEDIIAALPGPKFPQDHLAKMAEAIIRTRTHCAF